MSVNKLFAMLFSLWPLYKSHERGPKRTAAVDDAAPDFTGFPGAVVRTVVFKTQIKGHRNANDAYGLPGQGHINLCEMIYGCDNSCIYKTEYKGFLRPIEGHPESIIAFDVHNGIRILNAKSNKQALKDADSYDSVYSLITAGIIYIIKISIKKPMQSVHFRFGKFQQGGLIRRQWRVLRRLLKKTTQNIAGCGINANFGVKEVISQLNVVL